MRYPKYVFLTYGTYDPLWWTLSEEVAGTSSECTRENIAEVLEYQLAALHYPSSSFYGNSSQTSGDNGTVAPLILLDDRRNHLYTQRGESKFHHQCYDATLVLALALNKTISGKWR